MAVHDQERHYRLPYGDEITVRQLTRDDAGPTQVVVAAAWDYAYVAPGWLSQERRRVIADPDDQDLTAYLSDSIEQGMLDLAYGRPGSLHLGAFAVQGGAQIGMAKYSGVPSNNSLAQRAGVGTERGHLDEIDVLPLYMHRGVGRALAHAALLYAKSRDHLVFSLKVVQGNLRAKAFYEKHLGMRVGNPAAPVNGMPDAMRCDEMNGVVNRANRILIKRNPWLTLLT